VVTARWPASMKRKTAAEYLDMSEAAFEREVAAGRLPPPVTIGGRAHWKRAAIDKALDLLTGEREEEKPEYLREFEDRYGQAA
jgi:predicted DNA-binding transcriptional regulator AlpA